jgi:glucosamine--fructose-6-phosphate aminotransferase (isomerizing)
MEQESFQSLDIISKQNSQSQKDFLPLMKQLKKKPPFFVATLGRGSSDHAANFAKYAIEAHLGLMGASIAPSIHTLCQAKLNYKNSLVLGISQSGKSDDIIECLAYAKKQGALTVTFVNDERSPFATESTYCIPLLAGTEQAVAATKSFVASLSRIVQLVAYWSGQRVLLKHLETLVSLLQKQPQPHDKNVLEIFKNKKSLFVVGRGLGRSIALESALKFKECCGIHGEGLSGAELFHGPLELVKKNFPIFLYLHRDKSLPSMLELLAVLYSKKAKILLAGPQNLINSKTHPLFDKVATFPTMPLSVHPLCDSIASIYSFYPLVAQLAKLKGKNPDFPKNLAKITRTF